MNKAKEFWIVQKEVAELIKGRILVGHALHHDLKVLLLSHPKKDIRDTSEYEIFRREGKRRLLKDLAAQVLGAKIQQSEHCPIEDARGCQSCDVHLQQAQESMGEEHERTIQVEKEAQEARQEEICCV
uniref:Exonuclease domain-containing protein n=1 Tax=Arundo donax TaxID=35708 RepID=A0A0A9E1V8_ARUDO